MNKIKKLISFLFAGALTLSLTACAFVATNGSNPDTGNNVESNIGNSSDVGSNDSSDVGEHQHICAKTKEKAATCLAEGNIEYWTCLSCDKIFDSKTAETELTVEDVTIAKLAHKPKYVAETEASCNSTGNIEYWRCETCAKYFSDEAATTEITDKTSVVIGITHSSLTHTEAVKPNGKENGNIEYWYCGDCNNYYKDAACTQKTTAAGTVVLSAYNILDFIVEVPEDKEPVVLQLSDTQIIDAGQTRPGRTGVDHELWATDQIEERCYDYLTEVITATKPDFIIITGDVIYGEFDDAGTALVSLINFMDSFKIPWSPVFGNHDNESKKGVDWQCEQFENSPYCYFEQKELSGNGNYSVGIMQGDEVKRAFYMMDTNGCGGVSTESLANGHTYTSVGFKADQIAWYTEQITELKKTAPDVKISFAYHIQQSIFAEAYAKYGFNQSEKYQNINIDTHTDKADTDFGHIGRQLKSPWDADYSVFNGMKSLGVDSIFVGHEHCNNVSIVYKGIRFQYGLKSSEYDRFNFLNPDGTIDGNYGYAMPKTSTPLIGGTVIVLSDEDGVITDCYNYYCGFENGEIDWDAYKTVEVNGLQYGGVNVTSAEMWADGAVTAKSVEFDDTTNAYEVTANTQGKLYINTALLKGKTKVTFTVYLPSASTAKLGGYGQFAIRTKPNEAEPTIDGKTDGYIDYDTDSTLDSLKLKYDEWQTFTVDISTLQESCTEFAFVIAKGNSIYLKDVSIS